MGREQEEDQINGPLTLSRSVNGAELRSCLLISQWQNQMSDIVTTLGTQLVIDEIMINNKDPSHSGRDLGNWQTL